MTEKEIEDLKLRLKIEIKTELEKEQKEKHLEEIKRKEWAKKRLEELIIKRDGIVAKWNDSYRKHYEKAVDDFRHYHGI